MLEDVKEEFRDRIFSPVVTLTAFISQVLSEDQSCRKAVSRVDAERVEQGKDPCSPGTGGYCQARKRLSKDLIYQLLRETGDKLHGQSSPSWLWKGRRVVMADGSTVSMPDTSENQSEYQMRWSVEIGLKFIKEIMKMDILRCRTPDMVRKEVGVHLLAYNMIRTIMAQAADRIGIIPRSISFKGATQQLDSFADKIAHATGAIRIRLMEELSRAIAYHRIGNRPGRVEPRVVKRRPKAFPRMTSPRAATSSSIQ